MPAQERWHHHDHIAFRPSVSEFDTPHVEADKSPLAIRVGRRQPRKLKNRDYAGTAGVACKNAARLAAPVSRQGISIIYEQHAQPAMPARAACHSSVTFTSPRRNSQENEEHIHGVLYASRCEHQL